jgi:hypothetical protein
MLKPRRLPSLPISLAHPLDPGLRGVFVAAANVAFDHLSELVPKFVTQLLSTVRGVIQGAVTREQRHV